MDRNRQPSYAMSSRRVFLRQGLAVSAGTIGAGTVGAGLLSNGATVFAKPETSGVTAGDVAILRFLAAVEIIESDLWEQYNELGGIQDKEVPGGTGNPLYTAAILVLDGDMSQYIHDNTDDEFSHMRFLNAYLSLLQHEGVPGAAPISLKQFRSLEGSTADGVNKDKIGKRITNLLELTLDTSWWERYRSDNANPDFGASFANAVPGLAKGKFRAIPKDNTDTAGSTTAMPSKHLQAIANTAGFHFGFIEQGGTSLYPTLAQKVHDAVVLRILLSIGPSETMHFQVWHDKAGNAPAITDPTNGLEFPNLAGSTDPLLQANLIMPEPTIFLPNVSEVCAIIRPTLDKFGGAMAAVTALTDDGLFRGQSQTFFDTIADLAEAADAAKRGF